MRPLTESEQKMCEDYLEDTIAMSNSWRPPHGMDRMEWQSECILCLMYASQKWLPDGGRSFPSYIYLIIKCRWRDMMKFNHSGMRDVSRKCSLDAILDMNENNDSVISKLATPSPLDSIEDREYIDYAISRSSVLGSKTQAVVDQYSKGNYGNCAAAELGITKSVVDHELRKFVNYFRPIAQKQLA